MFEFQHPFTCLVSGPTQSGKTHFTFELLNHAQTMIKPAPTRIYWCYGEYQEKLKELPEEVILCEGLDVVDEIDNEENNLIILDDLMNEAGDAKQVAELFTKGSHHRNLSVILIVQNLFHKGKWMRTISLNSHYIILFKNPRDSGQIRSLANQLFMGHGAFVLDAYKQATSRPHGYLLFDLRQATPDNRRIVSDVLPHEEGFYYLPR